MKNLLITCLFLCLFVFGNRLNSQSKLEIIQYQLENGFTVILNPSTSENEVTGIVVAKVGSKDDPSTATGLAHYMEHMLFKGTPEIGTINYAAEKIHLEKIISLYDELAITTDEIKRTEIQKLINEESLKANEYVVNNELWNTLMEMGGTGLNAGTGPDATYYFNSFPPGQIENWLELYSHRFIEPVFRGFQAELEVVYEEKNMYSDMFFSNLLEQFNKNFFKSHPYGQQTTIGTIDHLKNPQLSKMIEFYNTWYVANNMALILSGNFSVEKVIPIIEEKFNRLKPGNVPEHTKYQEVPFNGREFVSGRYSPVKLGLIGYRTVTEKDPDRIMLDVANGILSNSASTGLLDQLMMDNKIMASAVFDMPYQDHGATIFLFIPKIIGQSLPKAEALITEQLENLKAGNFNDQLIETIKLEKYVNFQTSLESNTDRAMLIAESFVLDENMDEILAYPEKIMKVSREDVIAIANKYYGNNLLAFHSKMGFSKPEKIEKPGFKPVISNKEINSAYVNDLRSRTQIDIKYVPVDFKNDINTLEILPRVTLFTVANPINDIFNLSIIYQTGELQIKELSYLASALSYAGAGTKSSNQFRTEMGILGCSYSIGSDNDYFTINVSGPEKNLSHAVSLIHELLSKPDFTQTALDKIIEDSKLNRKFERAEPQSVAEALQAYVRYGERSPFINRLSMKEIKELNAEKLQAALTEVSSYQLEIHFSGNTTAEDLGPILTDKLLSTGERKPGTAPINHSLIEYPENTVFFTNNKKAIQSNINFLLNGQPFVKDNHAAINAFNTYFGGSFSGIVMQEIREFRSLSYSASGTYSIPSKEHYSSYYAGYVGTQADKTLEALDVYTGILKEMPLKPERIKMVRDYLSLSAQTARPGFRGLSKAVNRWKRLGYTEDPQIALIENYRNLEFSTLVDFHQNFIKNKPQIISIVANKKLIDPQLFTKYGTLKIIPEKDLYSN
jgi:zinc protease